MKLISAALVKFQSQLKPVSKDAENPFFKSNYLSLSGILENVVPLLTSNGLCISQVMAVEMVAIPDSPMTPQTLLITNLIHESGEKMSSTMILPIILDPQKLGSLITYYKRYQLQAMLGICSVDDDDDGNSVSNNSQPIQNKIEQFKESPATPAQLNALKKHYPQRDFTGLTKSAASKLFDEMNKDKK
jgi:hypothetical protein